MVIYFPSSNIALVQGNTNQSTDSTSGSIVSECRQGKWSWTRSLDFHLTLAIYVNSADPDQMLHFAASDLGLHCLPLVPVEVLQIALFTQYSDKNSTAINNLYRYLDFVQTHGWISLVNDSHVYNCLKEILAFVHTVAQL